MTLKSLKFKTITLGVKGEDEATEYLLNNSYRILQRNFRCKIGEIDIVAETDEFLVFVEVKARSARSKVSPLISITSRKRNKLRKLAEFYILKYKMYQKQPRLDVIAVTFSNDGNFYLEHIENAF